MDSNDNKKFMTFNYTYLALVLRKLHVNSTELCNEHGKMIVGYRYVFSGLILNSSSYTWMCTF